MKYLKVKASEIVARIRTKMMLAANMGLEPKALNPSQLCCSSCSVFFSRFLFV